MMEETFVLSLFLTLSVCVHVCCLSPLEGTNPKILIRIYGFVTLFLCVCMCVVLCHYLAQPVDPRVVWPGLQHRGWLCAGVW